MSLIRTSGAQIEVEVFRVVRNGSTGAGHVDGGKSNRQLTHCTTGTLWRVYFRDGEPSVRDGAGRLHPKLVMAAARAAWTNC